MRSSRDEEEIELAESPRRWRSHDGTDGQRWSASVTASGTRLSRASSSSAAVESHPIQRQHTRHDSHLDLERQRTTVSSTALSRIETERLQHAATVGESARLWVSRAPPLPPFGADGKPYPPPLPAREDYVVEFAAPDDPLYPQNWRLRRKVVIGAILAFTSLSSTFSSAIFSASTTRVAQVFHVSVEVSTLSSSLYIVGYAAGPLFWAPLSELRGRRLPVLIGMFGFSIFNTAVAVAKDLQTLLISRFFTGVFGSCPLTVVAAIFSDMFDNRTRGIAVAVFSMTVFLGPLLAPFIGGFINTSHLGWRWTAYIPAFMGYASFALNAFFLQESYPPVILVSKAAELRRRTFNWGIHAKQEEIEVDLRDLIVSNFSRPLRMLFYEPLLLAVTVYMSFVYGLLYCFLTAYPLVFQGVHGMSPGLGGLTLLGMAVGVAIAGLSIILSNRWYVAKLDRNGGMPVPEWRLPPVTLGGVLFAGGLFWFGWTGFARSILWIVPTLSGLLTGFGLLMIFIQLLNYIVDTYLMFAASAIAANTFVRSLVAASFPLFSRQMFNNMGIEWASTLLGCVAAALVPIPIAFYFFGRKLRVKSRFAPIFEKAEEAHDADEREREGDEEDR
ncbi:hypothetical protein VTO42DRAFT_6142 [Malbranchea cinnamomea]